METFQDAVTQLQSAEAGGFDFGAAQAAALLNEGVRRFAAASEWIKAELDLGATIAAQESYALPDRVVKLKGLAIAGAPYARTDVLGLWNLKQAGRVPGGAAGVYTERFSDDGKIKSFSLWPIPDASDLAIAGLAVITPDDLSGEDQLPFPPEYNRGPLDFAKGIAYEDLDENPQSGTYFRERAEQLAERLRLEGNSRSGSGPFQIPVMGHRGVRRR